MVESKKEEQPSDWNGVARVLAPMYSQDMLILDVVHVMMDAYVKASSEPRFAHIFDMTKLVTAPVWGFFNVNFPQWTGANTSVTVEKFYNSIVMYIWSQFRFMRVDWCKEELYG